MKITKGALLSKPYTKERASEVYEWWDEYSFADGDKKLVEQRNKEFNKKYKILYADYQTGNYEGSAYVLGYDNVQDKFFEVHGGHCSCYGLEGQWNEEYCTLSELKELITRRLKDRAEWYESPYNSGTFEQWLKEITGENK